MHNKKFDRSEHVYRNDSFLELIKDAVRFLVVRLFIHYHHRNGFKVLGCMLFTIQGIIHYMMNTLV